MKSTSPQSIERGLFVCGGLISFIITYISLTKIHSTPGLITFILFLPISLYFLALTALSLHHSLIQFLNQNQPRYQYFGPFSFQNFFSQAEIGFLITIFLFAIALSILLFKISLLILHEVR